MVEASTVGGQGRYSLDDCSYSSGVVLAADPPAIAAARPPPQRELDQVV